MRYPLIIMADHVGEVFLPGDILENLKTSEKTSKVILGPGLRNETDKIIVSKPGILKHKSPNIYWMDSHQKRYIPVKGDSVIGIVQNKGGDMFRIDIGGSDMASLSYLSFEGATKRNRPDVKVADLVYAKLLVANKDMEPELVCIDSAGRSDGMGVIGRDSGFLHSCSINLIRKILSPECPLLKLLGKSLPFEITVGMNGRIWVKAHDSLKTIAIINAISASEYMSTEQIKTMCKKVAEHFTEKS